MQKEQNSQNSQKRKWFKAVDIIIIISILVVSAFFLIINTFAKSDNSIAVISYDSRVVKTIDLNTAQNDSFRLLENPKVGFEIKEGKIRFIDAECPDKLCENSGFIDRINQTAICLPNKVSLRIEGEKADIDIIVN